MNPEANWFFEKPTKWKPAFEDLRELLLSCKLTETVKWGCPCYTYNDNNVVLMHGFKDYCALLFMKGALMRDPQNLLVQQTENVQSARQIRFHDVYEVAQQQEVLRAYIENAIEVEKLGLKVEFKETGEFKMADEFAQALNEVDGLQSAFDKLTPGRQRGYLLYFGSAKQSKTRMQRVEKYIPKILDGKGLDD